MIATLLANLAGQLIGLFGAKGKRAQELLGARVANMERSWTDEFIVIVFFAPLVYAWFDQNAANNWLAMLAGTPEWYRNLIFGITAAVFGLGKINGRKK